MPKIWTHIGCLAVAMFVGLCGVRAGLAQTGPDAGEIAAYEGLLAAAAAGDLAAITRLGAAGADVNAGDAQGRTPLIVATFQSQHSAASALIAAGADVNALEASRYDMLTIATVANDIEMVRLAIRSGADTGLVTSPYDGTALIAAAHLGHVEVVRTLIAAGAPLDHVNNLGWTALIEAIVLGDGGTNHVVIVKDLIAAGAEANTTHEIVASKRLGEEFDFGRGDAVLLKRRIAIARCKKGLYPGLRRPGDFRQIWPAHGARHHDIRKQQVDIVVGPQKPSALVAVARGNNVVTHTCEQIDGQQTNIRIIFDNEYFLAGCLLQRTLRRGTVFVFNALVNQREINFEASAPAGATAHVHKAVRLRNEPVDLAEPESCPFANFLGCEEWIKDVRQVRSGDAATGIGNFQLYKLTARGGARQIPWCRHPVLPTRFLY